MEMSELLNKVLEIMPNATIGEESDGQLVIYTGLQEVPLGTVTELPDA